MSNKNVRYRVFDSKGNYHQSYSSQLDGAFSWARDCAKRVGGYVQESSGDSSESFTIIFDARKK